MWLWNKSDANREKANEKQRSQRERTEHRIFSLVDVYLYLHKFRVNRKCNEKFKHSDVVRDPSEHLFAHSQYSMCTLTFTVALVLALALD